MESEPQLPQFSTSFPDYWGSDLPLIPAGDDGLLGLLGEELPSFSLSRSNSFMSEMTSLVMAPESDLAWTTSSCAAASPLLTAYPKQDEKAMDVDVEILHEKAIDLEFWKYMLAGDSDEECVVPASPLQDASSCNAMVTLPLSSTSPPPTQAKKAPVKIACNNKSALDQKWSVDYITMSVKDFNRCCKKTTTFTPDELAELKAARRRCKNRTYAKVARNKRLGRSATLRVRHAEAVEAHAHLKRTRDALHEAIVAAETSEGMFMIHLSVLS